MKRLVLIMSALCLGLNIAASDGKAKLLILVDLSAQRVWQSQQQADQVGRSLKNIITGLPLGSTVRLGGLGVLGNPALIDVQKTITLKRRKRKYPLFVGKLVERQIVSLPRGIRQGIVPLQKHSDLLHGLPQAVADFGARETRLVIISDLLHFTGKQDSFYESIRFPKEAWNWEGIKSVTVLGVGQSVPQISPAHQRKLRRAWKDFFQQSGAQNIRLYYGYQTEEVR